MVSLSAKRPVSRKDSFFGLHFDLHPNKGDTCLGADTSPDNIIRLVERVRPDYIQYDCKGHGGYTGYPTKIGWATNGIIQDALAIWQQTLRPLGIQLFIHYSGLWDKIASQSHPEWARIDPEGNPDKYYTSTFGPYVDELMIPQLKEVTSAYNLDGVWADGECWAAQLDYSPAARKAWFEETGYKDTPVSRDDPRWLEWKMFHRRQFEKYVSHWVDALHEYNPNIQLTSNWMYTTFAPIPVRAKLDFISGDYFPKLSVDRARVEARYVANTGMPWDLMAWGFNSGEELGSSLKTAVHLQQEATQVLMQGGGFQIYYNPTRSGLVYDEIIDIAGEVADFCRERQTVSHKSTSVPQVALLLSTETQFDRSDDVFTPYETVDELEGALQALLESHYHVDILAEHQLQPRLAEFPIVVIPDSYKLADDFVKSLIEYVNDGGALLLLGQQCARLFENYLGVSLDGDPEETHAELETNAGLVNENGVWQKVTPTSAEVFSVRYPMRGLRKDGEVAATINSVGKGKIAAVYGPLALNFYRSHHPWLRMFIGDIAAELFPDPIVEIDGPPCIDISLRHTSDGKLSLHLANLAGVPLSSRHTVIDFIPAIGPVTAKIQTAKRPDNVKWIPGDEKIDWVWENGVLTVTVPQLHIHGVILID